MTKLFWNALKFSPVVFAATFFATNSALAVEAGEPVMSVSQLTQASESQNIGQVTSVSQFSDVQPTDWAFQALQSLVERYGCIAGYPNGTYRGNRALTRYEFAAGLNACLDRVNELIATATADLVSKQDLATLQRLQEEFSAELATLRGRVDALEARTAELEANQFSTTTKLSGEAIFSVSQAFGDRVAVRTGNPTQDLDSNLAFANRVRLTLNSSFTGTDQLQTRLNAGNIISNSGTTGTGTNMTRLGYDGGTDNSVSIDKLNYAFNLSDSIRVKIDATGAELNENTNVFNPDFRSSGSGALSRYGRFSPIYRQGGDGAGITVNVNPSGPLTFTAAYIASGRNNAANPAEGFGLFDGNNTIFGQIAFKPSQALNLGFAYARTYQQGGDLFYATGGLNANRPFGNNVKTEANHYGFQATFQPSSTITLGGWVGYTTADAVNTATRSDIDAWYWGTSVGIKDFGGEGNVLGVIFGQPPRVTDASGVAVDDSDTSYHLEGLYKLKLSDNILITPGLLVIFNPENNDNNDPIYVGTLRTTFTF
ncbi:iron uptake porin [Nostoc parmelioides]|uniref:Iron uptake porin n=1 Tax=Nostoc parmelioides FACHB-3921 TaxID=2692909 RepID=A0ABR8BBH8_9NOSO|nr:iron uptake porin [Nostoc parmelioides]MBD2251206.1 iron uptake porin [Nostoc parmelioides FACHB-3921]